MVYKFKGREKEYDKEYRKVNREKILERQKKYYQTNKEKLIEQKRSYRESLPEEIKEKNKERDKQYYMNNREKKKAYQKIYYQKNKNKREDRDKINKQARQWILENYEKWREYQNGWHKNKRKTDLKFNLNHRMRNAIYLALKGNKAGRKWESLVGYTVKGLKRHLQKTMPKGYNWQDFMEGKLHIDHIIPISVFNFTKPEDFDFKRCWALENLQLLPAKENIRKSNKLIKPFQPTLKLK